MSRLRELVERLCPDGVFIRRLVSIANVQYGAPFNSASFNEEGLGLPLVRIRDVLNRRTSTYYSGDYDSRYVVQDGDILLGMDGNFNMRTWRGGKALLNQRVCRISTKDNSTVLDGYLYYFLTPLFKEMEHRIIGSTVAHLSARAINEVRIPVPPLEVQREVVRILDSFQELDDALTAEIEARERQFTHYRDSILSFTRGNANLGSASGPTKSRLRQLVEELCPDGVEYKALGDCLSPKKNSMVDGPFGSNLKKEHYTERHEVRVVQLSNIGEGGWIGDNERYTSFEHLKTISRHEAFPGDIVIAKMFPAGRAIILPDLGVKYVLSSDAIRFVPSDALDKKYAYYVINSSDFRRQVARDTQGATRPRTGIPKLKRNIIPVPPLEVQREVVRILDSFQELIGSGKDERDARRRQFAHYRDRLLSFPEKEA